MAMAKLWEKSLIAKIALKRGVQLTTSERMAEDIKVMELGSIYDSLLPNYCQGAPCHVLMLHSTAKLKIGVLSF